MHSDHANDMYTHSDHGNEMRPHSDRGNDMHTYLDHGNKMQPIVNMCNDILCDENGSDIDSIYIYIFIRTYFLQSSTQKKQLYTNKIYKKIILLKYMNKMNKMNSVMNEN